MADVGPSPEQPLLKVTKTAQYRTVDELLARSRPNSSYYTFLILSVFIVTSGILLGNDAIVIGGMLITPLLTPVLAIALGIAVAQPKMIKYVSLLVLQSLFIVVLISLVIALLFDFSYDNLPVVNNSIQVAILYLVVAITAGVAATFAWVRKEVAEILPGIAIAVTLVPPLSLIGIGLSTFTVDSFSFVRFYSFIVISNLLGIIVGSLVVFSLLKFYKSQERVEKDIKKVEKEVKAKKEEKKKTTVAGRDQVI